MRTSALLAATVDEDGHMGIFLLKFRTLPSGRHGKSTTVIFDRSTVGQGAAMSRSRIPARNDATDASAVSERSRLEGRLAKREAWISLQRLRGRADSGRLSDALATAAERERLEGELSETCEDYRKWVALTSSAQQVTAAPQFKTRVRVKAATKVAAKGTPVAMPAAVLTQSPAKVVSASNPTPQRRSDLIRVGLEEARVVIVRRAKNGTVTRVELPGRDWPSPARDRPDSTPGNSDRRMLPPDAAPQPIAKRPGKR